MSPLRKSVVGLGALAGLLFLFHFLHMLLAPLAAMVLLAWAPAAWRLPMAVALGWVIFFLWLGRKRRPLRPRLIVWRTSRPFDMLR